MRVIHVLKDGREIEDITGHIVRVEDAEPLYRMIRNINKPDREYTDREAGSKSNMEE